MPIGKRLQGKVKRAVKGAARRARSLVEQGQEGTVVTSRDVGLDNAPVASEPPPLPTTSEVAAEASPNLDTLTSSNEPKLPAPIEPDEVEEAEEIKTVSVDGGRMSSELDEALRETVKAEVLEMIQTVYDPEIPVNVYELGLIYDVIVSATGHVDVRMTLTSPNCPAAQSLPGEVEVKASSVEHVQSVVVDIVWDPPWEPSMMSEGAQLELNMM